MAAALSEKKGIALSLAEKEAHANSDVDLTTFRTVQEKIDSWTNEDDGLELGLFRIDPPKPMGMHFIALFTSLDHAVLWVHLSK